MANIPTRNNNPGDLRDPNTGTFRTFANSQQGFDALKNDISGKITGNTHTGLNGNSTLQDFASVWAPNSDGNNSAQYAQNLATKLGVNVNTPISQLGNRLDDFASAIADNEGYQGNRVSGATESALPHPQVQLTPQGFKQLIVSKYPDGVSSDGTPYSQMDATDLTKKIVAKFPDGVTSNGVKYSDFLGSVNAPQDQGPSIGGFIDNSVSSIGNIISGLANVILHPIQTVKNLAQVGGGAVESAFGANNEDTQKFHNVVSYFKNRYGGDSVSEVVNNIGKTLYTDAPGALLDLSTLLDGVGGAVGAVGKIADVSKAAELAKASDFIATASGIIKGGTPAAIDALKTPGTLTKIGDAIQTVADYTNPLAPVTKLTGAAANKVSQLSDGLPRRIINNILPQLKTPGLKDYAIDNLKVGSVDSMLKTSQDALDNYSSQIKTILQHPDNAGIEITGENVVNKVLKEFPNSEYTPEQIFAKMKTYVPGEAKLVTKLQDGSLSLDEANTLRQALDEISYKLKIDSPEIKAGKELAGTMGHALRDSVQTLAPETQTIFANFSKEINLKKALVKLSLKSEKGGVVSVKELLGALGAGTIGGPVAEGAMLAGEKIADLAATKVLTAKVLKKVVAPPVKAIAKVIKKAAPFEKQAAQAGKISGASQ